MASCRTAVRRRRNKLRTPPLWGLHVRGRLMHDLTSLTFDDAIARHRGEATNVISATGGCVPTTSRLKVFLSSL